MKLKLQLKTVKNHCYEQMPRLCYDELYFYWLQTHGSNHENYADELSAHVGWNHHLLTI